ncbi:MAG TPA: site-2 protease family protein [Gaiellaceae bacterium]|nr:site-2 protease family protein [Gaiellaceae bacterium]
MHPSLTFGRIAGIRVSVNWSWLVVFALIAWTLASGVFPAQDPGLARATYVAMALVASGGFFACLLLHELGHAVEARRQGMEIDGITLWLFGGVAQFKGAFPSAVAELRIALAGPLVSALLGGSLVVAAATPGLGRPVGGVLAWLGYINLILLAFNMLPALPLDGGRVLRALLWRLRGDFAWATNVAATVGQGFGYLLVSLGVLLFIGQGVWSGVWLAFMGWFLLEAATAEARYGLMRSALGDLRVGDLTVREPVTVAADATLEELMEETVRAHRFTAYPVVDGGRVVGLFRLASVAEVPREDWVWTPVRECTVPFEAVPTLPEDEPLVDAVAELGPGTLGRALVLREGMVVGLLSVTDIGRLVASAGRRRRDGDGERPRRGGDDRWS